MVVLPGSPDGRDLAPRLAAALHRPLFAGATEIAPRRVHLARSGGRELHELHPWDPPTPRAVSADAEFAESVDLAAEADPRLVLSRAADLLVIGPRGPGLLKSLHLGSTADWLLAHPPAPLLIARHGGAVQTAVVCADGSPHAQRSGLVVARTHYPSSVKSAPSSSSLVMKFS